MFYRSFLKRVIDVFLALAMLILFSPIFLILTIFLSVYHLGNPFFSQSRPGLNGKNFLILKFKTMKDTIGPNGELLPDSERLTKVGKWVRKTSLDEMPQLLNVIKGDMSLVGPRPLLEEYLELYTDEQARRHEVKPGVSGWAQINGRNAISWDKKFDLDVWYVDNYGFFLDWKILFITLFNVLLGKGITQKGHVTVGKFKGNSERGSLTRSSLSTIES
ncbi:sugar transferase [Algoriphagus sediminis]|uniref:Sugar transferase n=1 Tax=Algoriphagus sediminis TaxID=3057113 RepID=A0ABT7YDW4_9BACT|nr:sugar transferase [Algoriphagus sediminis]MDN3204656.1 sugar transferase [Algoriphagus sediminis]